MTPIRAFAFTPDDVGPFLESLALDGAEFILDPPQMFVRVFRPLTDREVRAFGELKPFIYERLITLARLAGRFFCTECNAEVVQFPDEERPVIGQPVICLTCFTGNATFARLAEMCRRVHGPYWMGDN